MARAGTFKKGHKFGKGSNGQLRRDLTVELISQLNETLKDEKKIDRPKLYYVVKNLIDRAIEHVPVYDKDGKQVGVEKGDLTAIVHIFDRLEGRPTKKVDAKTETTVREYKSLEDVMATLIERGLDVERLPPPWKTIEYKKKH